MDKELNKYKNLTYLFGGIVIGALVFGLLFMSYNKFDNKKNTSYQYSGNELDITDYEKDLNKNEKVDTSTTVDEPVRTPAPTSTPVPVGTPVPVKTPTPVRTPVPTSTPAPKKDTSQIIESFSNTTTTDRDVLSYIDTASSKVQSNDITEAGASTYFTTLVDFLFYGGTIKGHTFSELSESAKLKVTAAASAVMDFIEAKFPGLTASLSNEYRTAKSKIKNFYNTQKTKYCGEHPEVCAEFNLDYENFKKYFGGTFSSVGNTIVSKLEEWYQIYKAS